MNSENTDRLNAFSEFIASEESVLKVFKSNALSVTQLTVLSVAQIMKTIIIGLQ